MIVRLKSATPLRGGAQYIREGLNEGGFRGASIVLPSTDPSTHFLIARPRHLGKAKPSWERFKRVVEDQDVPLPDIEVTEPCLPSDLTVTLLFTRGMYSIIANENLRLTRLTKPWPLKHYFLETLDVLERQLVEHLRTSAPIDPLVTEFDKR